MRTLCSPSSPGLVASAGVVTEMMAVETTATIAMTAAVDISSFLIPDIAGVPSRPAKAELAAGATKDAGAARRANRGAIKGADVGRKRGARYAIRPREAAR
jgi:hypothetical protein